MTKKNPDHLCKSCSEFDYAMNRRDGVSMDMLVVCDHDEDPLSDNCEPLCRPQQNGLGDGIDPPDHILERRTVDVRGREEHEAIIKDASKCKELGLDQVYETIVYLNRWGSWLGQ